MELIKINYSRKFTDIIETPKGDIKFIESVRQALLWLFTRDNEEIKEKLQEMASRLKGTLLETFIKVSSWALITPEGASIQDIPYIQQLQKDIDKVAQIHRQRKESKKLFNYQETVKMLQRTEDFMYLVMNINFYCKLEFSVSPEDSFFSYIFNKCNNLCSSMFGEGVGYLLRPFKRWKKAKGWRFLVLIGGYVITIALSAIMLAMLRRDVCDIQVLYITLTPFCLTFLALVFTFYYLYVFLRPEKDE